MVRVIVIVFKFVSVGTWSVLVDVVTNSAGEI